MGTDTYLAHYAPQRRTGHPNMMGACIQVVKPYTRSVRPVEKFLKESYKKGEGVRVEREIRI